MKRMKRLVCLILSAMLLASLVACGGGSTGSTSGTTTVTKDTITFAYQSEPSNLSPTEQNELGAAFITRMVYSGLFKFTSRGIEPDLCTEYHTEKDANGVESIWVFKLREGVKFSDGTDLTAQDVVDSLTFAHEQPVVKSLTGFYTKVEADGEYTVKLYTDGVYATVPDALAEQSCFIVPSELLAKGHDFANNPVGSGPYKLVKWNKGENIELTINENYYDKDNFPSIKNVNWKIMAEGTTRTLALESGEVDVVLDVATLDIPRLKDNSDVVVSVTNASQFNYLMMQADKAPFNDVNFRKFMAAAINREDIISVALDGYATPINACINVCVDGSTDENATTYNPEKAKEYLKAWGGDPASVQFEMLASNDVRRRIAETIQNALKEYGINCTVSNVESATCSSLARSGEYDAIVFAYNTNDFATYAKNLYYVSDAAHAGNKFRMSGDDSLNPLIDQINSTTDAAARAKLITDFTKQLNARQPVVPLYCAQTLLAYHKDIKGLEPNSKGQIRVEEISWG